MPSTMWHAWPVLVLVWCMACAVSAAPGLFARQETASASVSAWDGAVMSALFDESRMPPRSEIYRYLNTTLLATGTSEAAMARTGACTWRDWAVGEWATDPRLPPYYPVGQGECYSFGDPRRHYTHRWVPLRPECAVPRLDTATLNAQLGTRRVVFTGDSHYSRQGQSMQRYCRHADPPCSFEVVVAKNDLLVQGRLPPAVGRVSDLFKTTVASADVLVIGFGHHFGKNSTGSNEHAKIAAACMVAVDAVLAYLRDHFRGVVVWELYTPRHFQHFEYNEGGDCASPVPGGDAPEALGSLPAVLGSFTPAEWFNLEVWHNLVLRRLRRAALPRLLVSDITTMSLLRPYSHVQKYYRLANVTLDCSHYCYPGLPDVWNEVVFHTLLQSGLL